MQANIPAGAGYRLPAAAHMLAIVARESTFARMMPADGSLLAHYQAAVDVQGLARHV